MPVTVKPLATINLSTILTGDRLPALPQTDKAFLIAKPMIKASWTKCCGAGGGSVDGWGGTVVARRLAGLIG